MRMRQLWDPRLAQYAYLIGCDETRQALVLDPARDADRYVDEARSLGLEVVAVAETHVHADFLSGARNLAHDHGLRVYLSAAGDGSRYEWPRHGGYDVTYLQDGDRFAIGSVELEAFHTPGHTPEHLSFLVYDKSRNPEAPVAVATGDSVWVGDVAPPDLVEQDNAPRQVAESAAKALRQSLKRLLELPDFVQVWPGHSSGGEGLAVSTVGYERRSNPAFAACAAGEAAFVDFLLTDLPEPPLYFSHIQRLNRQGAPILGTLPTPPRVSAETLLAALDAPKSAVIDTRGFRLDFAHAHLAGSLYAPLGPRFATTVGSYVEPDEKLYFIAPRGRVQEVVRDLVRIGFSRLAGYAPPAILNDLALAVVRKRTPVFDFRQLESVLDHPNTVVLDVRGAAEHAAGHIPGALHVAHTRLKGRMGEIPPEGEVVVHSATGGRAATAVAALERAGHRVYLIDDAFARWKGPRQVGRAA